MAQMTRAQIRTELQNRGWSRFLAADLDRYIDWGLRDVMREAKWKDTWFIASIVNHTAEFINFTDISGSSTVSAIKKVYLSSDGKERTLDPEEDEAFFEDWLYRDLQDPSNKGTPSKYYVYLRRLYLIPVPQTPMDFTIHFVKRLVSFAADGSTSGLPERFDEAIVPAAEAHCFRRAHETERMVMAMAEMRRIVLAEITEDAQTMEEQHTRVIPYR